MSNYVKANCQECDVKIVVEFEDLADNNYCTTCSWDIIGDLNDNYKERELV